MAALLALLSALSSGAGDFLGGLATRRILVLATRDGLLTVVAVLAALYPASTLLLARLVLGEHLARLQRLGVLLAAVAIGLLAAA